MAKCFEHNLACIGCQMTLSSRSNPAGAKLLSTPPSPPPPPLQRSSSPEILERGVSRESLPPRIGGFRTAETPTQCIATFELGCCHVSLIALSLIFHAYHVEDFFQGIAEMSRVDREQHISETEREARHISECSLDGNQRYRQGPCLT